MKVYTKSGDRGKTALIGGTRVPKNSPRVSAYGSVDEANAWLGSIISELDPQFVELKTQLTALQVLLFDIGTDLANPAKDASYIVTKKELTAVEKMIDQYSAQVTPIEKFILPGGHLVAGHFHILRTVTRRAERETTELVTAEDPYNEQAYKVLNRLSDLFFVLARYINQQAGVSEPFYERAGKVFH